ncbi:uncharacterized protein LOC131041672 isoform X2 [Cryptomeria japonica]|uniref:uncharacterized protein LOC131041672 isoform X2 n=1 Tax=Cryptomeria japonica TaxID=3369 RepID=UPI0027DA9F07|nr:uncharacterized protein LOC131041672 isoform X2 [Cryptomeria japonica]
MSANSKSVISCSIQDRSKLVAGYSNRQRGHFSDSLSRRGSCESGISKAGQSSPQLSLKSKLKQEILHLSQVLSSERLSLEPQKDVCHAELRRVIKTTFDTAAEVSSFGNVQAKSLASLGPAGLKRVKASVSDDYAKAREQGKFLNEAISKLENFRCNVPSRKRIRSEITSENRNSSLANYWSAGGAVLQKSASPVSKNQANLKFVDLVFNRAYERNKTLGTNKQVRTLVLEGQVNVNLPKSFGKSDQEIDVSRPGSSCLSQVEENDCAQLPAKRILKMMRIKGKRSQLKTDISLPSMVNGALDGKCEQKLSLKDKLNRDSRVRRNEVQGNRSTIHDKNQAADIRTSSASVTQRLGKRSNKKTCIARRKNSVSPTSNQIHDISSAEGSACAAVKEAKSDSHRILGSGHTSKCHRPRNKLKNENLNYSTGIVGSKSVEGENENTEITKNNASTEVKLKSAGSSFGKLILPTKKSKFGPKKGSEDSAHWLVRSRRDLLAGSTSVCQDSDTMDITSNTKPLRNLGALSDKVKSKPSRFLIEKSSSDYNPLTQPRCPVNSGSSDLTGGMDDDCKELLAAIEDANNARSLACSKPFWKEVEPYFRIVTQDDLDFLKQQVMFASDETRGCPSRNVSSHRKSLSSANVEDSNLSFLNNQEDMQATRSSPGIDGIWLEKMTPLSQRLLSALMVVDENDQVTSIDNDNGHKIFDNVSEVSPHKNHVEKCSEDKTFSRVEPEIAGQLQMHNNERLNVSHDSTSLNGYINYLSEVYVHSDKNGVEYDILEGSDIDISKADSGNLKERHMIRSQRNQFGLQSGCQTNCVASGIASHEIEYQQMSLDEKILLELHSIGLFLDSVPDLESEDDDSIEEELNKLRKELREKVCKTEAQIIHLEKAVSESWKVEERECERLALNKLVLRASKRYLGPRGRGFHRRSAAKKVEQQANLDFVKRTLHRCKKFDKTGKSCFNETSLKEKFFPIASKETTTKSLENAVEGKMFHAIQNGGDTESPSVMKPSAFCLYR